MNCCILDARKWLEYRRFVQQRFRIRGLGNLLCVAATSFTNSLTSQAPRWEMQIATMTQTTTYLDCLESGTKSSMIKQVQHTQAINYIPPEVGIYTHYELNFLPK